MNKSTAYINSPLGTIKLIGTVLGVETISFLDQNIPTSKDIPECLKKCIQQLEEYFAHQRKDFDFLLHTVGTDFQCQVWDSLTHIAYGTTVSYLQQARTIGDVKAIRAVASANGKNPIAIVIPCHRIIGTDGSLTGYAGGIWRKKWLLAHEQGVRQTQLF